MLLFFLAVCSLAFSGRCVCESNAESSEQRNAVFVDGERASTFLGRHLLFNRFDFEIFTPGNLERECLEEVCNYEEAREVFENDADTATFWKEYTSAQKPGPKLDVTALLVGIITGGVAIIIVGLLIWYSCQRKCKNERFAGPIRARSRRSNASVIIRRLEEVSLYPIPPPSEELDPHALPSYDQAIAASGPHDAPPPPYPGSKQNTIQR